MQGAWNDLGIGMFRELMLLEQPPDLGMIWYDEVEQQWVGWLLGKNGAAIRDIEAVDNSVSK